MWCGIKKWHICRPDLTLPWCFQRGTRKSLASKELAAWSQTSCAGGDRADAACSELSCGDVMEIRPQLPPSLPRAYISIAQASRAVRFDPLLFLQLNLENAFAATDGAENGFTHDSRALSWILIFSLLGNVFIFRLFAVLSFLLFCVILPRSDSLNLVFSSNAMFGKAFVELRRLMRFYLLFPPLPTSERRPVVLRV